MTTETETNRGRFFVTSLLPWMVGAGMLLVYLLTQNHLPGTNNVDRILELQGWYTPQRYFAPLTYLLTYPLHWVPAALVGTGLNLFAAVCGALTLALLARSVALLPHDRTHDQRARELNEHALLSIPAAWLPPLFAALVCGLQMTFWENAASSASESARWLRPLGNDAAGEMLDLLLFAYCVRCLLEYRISSRESWMARFAFVYGLGMANNWLMVAFFPGFLAAIIWIRGVSVFSTRFLAIASVCGLAGLSLILFFPIVASLNHTPGFGFWQTLQFVLRSDKFVISTFNAQMLLLFSLTSLLPVFIIGIRWASYFGDTSQIGIFLATFVFHIVHAVFLLACIWVAFDPPVSPREKALGLSLLPFYYLGALSVGYFVGYFLLVFGTRPAKERHRPHPILQFINFIVTASVWVLAITVPIFLVWINLPQVRAHQATDAAYARLSALTAESLPQESTVVLGDDSLRLSMLEEFSQRGTEKRKHLFLNTYLLAYNSSYIRSLERKFPEFKLGGYLTNWNPYPSVIAKIYFLEKMAQEHPVYYIEPSFGSYFERFYLEPHGLVYRLKEYDTNTWKAPALTPEQIEENQKYWKSISDSELPVVSNLIIHPKLPASSSILQYVMDTGHLSFGPNTSAELLGSWYARAADYWGVELERAGLLPEAGKCFDLTLLFNYASVAGRVNSQFNKDLRAGKKITIEPPSQVRDQFGKFRGWDDLLNTDGPFDDPSFCYVLGVTFAAGDNYHPGMLPPRAANYLQAIQQFERVYSLAPDYPDVGYWLCSLFLRFRKESETLTIAEHLLQHAPDDPAALYYKSVALMQLHSYDKAVEPLNHLLTLQTNNYQAMLERAINYLQLSNYSAAKPDYETLVKVAPRSYQIDYGLQEIAFQQKNTNDLVKYLHLYLTNYYHSFPTNAAAPETDEVKLIKQRLKESTNGAP